MKCPRCHRDTYSAKWKRCTACVEPAEYTVSVTDHVARNGNNLGGDGDGKEDAESPERLTVPALSGDGGDGGRLLSPVQGRVHAGVAPHASAERSGEGEGPVAFVPERLRPAGQGKAAAVRGVRSGTGRGASPQRLRPSARRALAVPRASSGTTSPGSLETTWERIMRRFGGVDA